MSFLLIELVIFLFLEFMDKLSVLNNFLVFFQMNHMVMFLFR